MIHSCAQMLTSTVYRTATWYGIMCTRVAGKASNIHHDNVTSIDTNSIGSWHGHRVAKRIVAVLGVINFHS